ncbi:Glutamate--tRNA ligase mitochondrial [Tulasnella sp. 403]|nr:Glutamate--tRNA ligase mitochondrial [Tulasnella sp. 403]
MSVRLRFAPSPTGALHLGGLRTALYNYLTARRLGGTFTLRIEDTDRTRLVPGSVDNIIKGLQWAGIEYDHGPRVGGPDGPDQQSERLDLYRYHASKLLESGRAYRCFCTPETLAYTRERLLRMRSNATYDRACLQLTEEEVARRVKAGERHVIRLNTVISRLGLILILSLKQDGAIPHKEPIKDIVFGALRDGHGSLPTDPIMLKSDLFPTYHLASVVDDHEMKITHVVRGEEWLQSLPLHIDLYAALGLTPPQFAHLPLLLNPDGSKMSKRKGDVQVSDYMEKGWEPESVINWLALAGWGSARNNAHGTDTDHLPPDGVLTKQELIEKFDISTLTHRRTILDPGKLANLNKQHLGRKLSGHDAQGLEDVTARADSVLRAMYPESKSLEAGYITRVVKALLPRVDRLPDIQQPELSSHFFREPDLTSEQAAALRKTVKESSYSRFRLALLKAVVISSARLVTVLRATLGSTALEQSKYVSTETIRDALHVLQENELSGLSSKEIMNTLRHALTGSKASVQTPSTLVGPSIPEIFVLLGQEKSKLRLQHALQLAEKETSQASS